MNKRLSIRLTPKLSENLKQMALERGTSMNGLISQILWEFIERYYEKRAKEEERGREDD